MVELKQLQRHFADGLLGEPATISPHISSRLFPAESVLQVYRNHFILSLGEVLASSYPAVKAMVGDEFFVAAARGFVLDEPLQEGNVMHYGAGFGQWLARLPTTAELPWLEALRSSSGSLSVPVCCRWSPAAGQPNVWPDYRRHNGSGCGCCLPRICCWLPATTRCWPCGRWRYTVGRRWGISVPLSGWY